MFVNIEVETARAVLRSLPASAYEDVLRDARRLIERVCGPTTPSDDLVVLTAESIVTGDEQTATATAIAWLAQQGTA